MGRDLSWPSAMAAALCFIMSAAAADGKRVGDIRWPQFRGPNGLGVAANGMKLPVQFGPDKNVLWKSSLPVGHSSPCIWGDRIFLTGFEPKTKKLETICLDRKDGAIVWRRAAPAEKIERLHEVNTPASPTPAADGERVYVYFGSYGVVCYDFKGEEKWKQPLLDHGLPWGSGASPIVAGDYVIVNAGHKSKAGVMALHRKTGDKAWEKERSRGGALFPGAWSAPVHYRHDGEDEVIVAGCDHLAAYNLEDGAERWRVRGLPPVSYSTPIINGDLMYLTLTDQIGDPQNVVQLPSFEEFAKKYDKNKDGKISRDEVPDDFTLVTRDRPDKIGNFIKLKDMMGRFDRNQDGALDKEEWTALLAETEQFRGRVQIAVVAIRLGGKGDVSKSHVVWQETKGVPEVPSPLCYQGRLYLVKERAIVSCLDPKTGKTLYRERLGASGQCYASPVAGDGKIYIGTDTGWMVVINAGDKYEVLAKNNLREPIMATPALVDGKIYVRTEKHLYAFGE